CSALVGGLDCEVAGGRQPPRGGRRCGALQQRSPRWRRFGVRRPCRAHGGSSPSAVGPGGPAHPSAASAREVGGPCAGKTPPPNPPPRSGEGEKDNDSSFRREGASPRCSRSAPPLRFGEGAEKRGSSPESSRPLDDHGGQVVLLRRAASEATYLAIDLLDQPRRRQAVVLADQFLHALDAVAIARRI